MVSHTEEMFSRAEAQRAQSFSQSILSMLPPLGECWLSRCVSKSKSEEASGEQSLLVLSRAPKLFERSSKSDCLWGGCMLCFKLSWPLPLGGRGVGLPLIHRKGSARRMQSRARSSYAEPQPSLAMYLKYIAKVRIILMAAKYRPS